MRILSITAQKPHSTGSGVYLTELVKGFAAMGHQQAVIAGVCREDTAHFPPDVSFDPVLFQTDALPFPIAGMSDEMPYESTVYSRMTPAMAARFKAAFLDRARRTVEAFRPDVILCHHLYLLTALVREQFPALPVVGICHGTGLRQLMKNPLEREYIKAQIPRLNRICVLHEAQKQAVLDMFPVPSRRVAVIGSGFNDSLFRDMGLAKDPSRTTLIYAGKLAEKKGVMSLLRAVNLLDGPLTIKLAGGAGNEAEETEIHLLAERCRHPVQFLGRLDQGALAEQFNRSDLFVLPSFYEGLPLVLMEALACGLAAISTDLPGVREWMDKNIPGNGIRYVPAPPMRSADEPLPGSLPAFEEALARCIAAAMESPKGKPVDLRGVSWKGVCARVLDALQPAAE